MTTSTIPGQTGKSDYGIPAGQVVIGADAMDADRDAWLGLRRTGVTATDMRVLRGFGYADETVYDRWLDKISDEPAREAADTPLVLRLGNMLEPIIQQLAEEHLGVAMRRVGMVRSKQHDFMLASPDRNAADGGGAEFKNTSSFYLRNYRDEHSELTNGDGWTLSPAWWAQVQHQLACTGWSHMHVCALIGDMRRMTYWLVEPDPREQDLQAALAELFWRDCTEQSAPPLDWDTVTAAEVKARWPKAEVDSVTPDNAAEVAAWVSRYTELTALIGPLEKEKKALATVLKAAAGDAAEVLDGNGRRLYQYVNRSRAGVDVDRLAADAGLNLDDYKTKTTYRALAGFPKAGE